MVGRPPGEVYESLEVERRGTSDSLVVALHAFRESAAELHDIRGLIEAEDCFANTDLLIPSYHAVAWANTDIYLVASQLESYITDLCEERQRSGAPYTRIVLIGHSIGALIIRKCYVWAQGSTEDHPTRSTTKPREWVQRVERIVLLASTNRGWSVAPRPKHMPRWRHAVFAILLTAARLFGRGRLIRSAQRGSPFVADLRVQWIRLADRLEEAMAPTIQLLGDVDDIVDREDNRDTLAAKNFIFIPVAGTGHRNIRILSDDIYGKIRRRRFQEALTGDSLELKRRYGGVDAALRPAQLPDGDPDNGKVVFLMHGIRDFGHWRQALEGRIKAFEPDVVVVTSGYGWFPLARFLIARDRQKNVRWFMDRYTEELARRPRATFSFFGHSNGTYLVASALRHYPTMRFDRVAFAGSVVPRAFPWRRYMGPDRCRLTSLRNDMGNADFTVAVFPRFYELLHELFRGRSAGTSDIGSGGFNGFEDDMADDHQVYLEGGHDAGIRAGNHESIARFLLRGELVDSPHTRQGPARWVSWASSLCWLVWAFLAAVLGAAGLLTWLISGPWGLTAFAVVVLGLLFTA